MKLWSGMPIALAAFFCIGCVAERADDDYSIQSECIEDQDSPENELEDCELEDCEPEDCEPEDCAPICEEPCEKECWEREICYEPVYYTTQRCVERQIPTKKKCARLVPKEYTVQRMRYVPEYYTEKIVKNEMEYYFVDDWKVRTEMICERQCEWVPRSVWKKVTKESCDLTYETKQDE